MGSTACISPCEGLTCMHISVFFHLYDPLRLRFVWHDSPIGSHHIVVIILFIKIYINFGVRHLIHSVPGTLTV